MASESSAAAGKLGVETHYNHTVPLTRHTEKIMVDITGPWTEKGKTANLDLVVVLDTSLSMEGQKLQDVRQAAKFVIRKMGKLDTLTFVPFSDDAGTPSAKPPPYMSSSAKDHAVRFVDALRAHGNTNIKAALQAAVRILHDRRDKTGRAAGIFLMSDGEENRGHARDVDVSEFRVYTFGFGHEHDRHLLENIARKSHGGTYHNTPHSTDTNKLLQYFAKILGEIRDVSALNLKVTLIPHAGARIQGEKPGGDYWITNGPQGSITIDYGFLARNGKRRIIVDLLLPAVETYVEEETVMTVKCTYRLPKVRECTDTHAIVMARDANARLQQIMGLFKVELARRHQADRIKKVKSLADANTLDKAMDELAEAKNHLAKIEDSVAGEEEDEDEDCANLLDALARELEHLEELMDSHKAYSDHGSAYMLAVILSHDRQSFAARGWDDDGLLFTLPRMLKYARQADEFHQNPHVHI